MAELKRYLKSQLHSEGSVIRPQIARGEMDRSKTGPLVVLADVNLPRRSAVRDLLADRATVLCYNSVTELWSRVEAERPDLIVIGSLLESFVSPIEPVLQLHASHPGLKVVFIADVSSEDLAISAIRAGVRQYFKGPVSAREVADAVIELLPPADPDVESDEEMAGSSAQMRWVKQMIGRFASTDATVLITGETGTGKELIASSIHRKSRRAATPMVSVNCAAIPDTLIESELFGFERGAFTGATAAQKGKLAVANGGTVFLDEVGDMSLGAQAKILRALESREIQPLGARKPIPIDIRVIAATHHDLEASIARADFRADLFFRLNVGHIHVPPLRERLEDIPDLVGRIMDDLNGRSGRSVQGLTTDALRLLREHDWPGNVRQLRNVLESAFVMCTSDRITRSDLFQLHRSSSPVMPLHSKMKSPVLPIRSITSERDELKNALAATDWNKTQAADLLQWSRMTVYRKIAQYGLKRKH